MSHAGQKPLTPEEQARLDALIPYYNDRIFNPRVFPAHQQKIHDAIVDNFNDVDKLIGRVSRMSDPHKITHFIRDYMNELNARGVARNDRLLLVALTKFEQHVNDEFLADVAAAEREKLAAAAVKAQERAQKALEKEAEKEERKRQRAESAAEKAAEKEAEKEERKRQKAAEKAAEKAAGATA